MKIYKDNFLNKNSFIRTFDENIDEINLMWHRDENDRLIELIEGNWLIQIDNELPQEISKLIIKKETFHRLIKKDGKLVVKITLLD